MSIKTKRLSKGARKYIRLQKARLKREFLDKDEREKQITELYSKFEKKLPNSEHLVKTKKK